MKKIISLVFSNLLLITLLSSCGSSYDGMSSRYHTDSEYRNNVNSAANAYGVSPKEAEDSAERVIDALR